MDEQKLLLNLKKKKRDALEQTITQYTPYVSVVVYNVIGLAMTREDMEEVVSDVFLSLWGHVDALDDTKGSLRGYLGAVARNAAKNKLRQLRSYVPLEDHSAVSPGGPEAELEIREQRSRIWDLVLSLGEPDSEIFLRYYHYNEKIREIAQRTGLPIPTVKTKLRRGREKLKEQITKGGTGYEESLC